MCDQKSAIFPRIGRTHVGHLLPRVETIDATTTYLLHILFNSTLIAHVNAINV